MNPMDVLQWSLAIAMASIAGVGVVAVVCLVNVAWDFWLRDR
jgi:hypothetical protein